MGSRISAAGTDSSPRQVSSQSTSMALAWAGNWDGSSEKYVAEWQRLQEGEARTTRENRHITEPYSLSLRLAQVLLQDEQDEPVSFSPDYDGFHERMFEEIEADLNQSAGYLKLSPEFFDGRLQFRMRMPHWGMFSILDDEMQIKPLHVREVKLPNTPIKAHDIQVYRIKPNWILPWSLGSTLIYFREREGNDLVRRYLHLGTDLDVGGFIGDIDYSARSKVEIAGIPLPGETHTRHHISSLWGYRFSLFEAQFIQTSVLRGKPNFGVSFRIDESLSDEWKNTDTRAMIIFSYPIVVHHGVQNSRQG